MERVDRGNAPKLRKLAIERDGKCIACDFDCLPLLTAHHKRRVSQTGDNSLDNLVTLCPNCHAFVHLIANHSSARVQDFNAGYKRWASLKVWMQDNMNASLMDTLIDLSEYMKIHE